MAKNKPSAQSPHQINKAVISENYFSKIFEYGFDAIVVTDNSNNIKAWNKVAEKMFGYSLHEVIGKPISKFLIIDDNIRSEFRTLVRETGQWKGEVDVINKDGKKLHTIISISTIKDKDGSITDLIGIIQNISEKISLQENLLETSNKLQLIAEEKASFITEILERIDDGFASFDKDLNITYVNTFFEKLFNKPAEKLIGLNIKKISAYFKSIAIVEQTFLNQTSIDTEYYSEPFNKWFFLKLYPSPNGISVFVNDITEKKITEKKLIQSEQFYSSLFENASDLIGIINAKGNVLKVNQGMETLFGYTKEEALKMNIKDFVFSYDNLKFPFDLAQVPDNKNLILFTRYKKKDGSKFYAELNASLLPDGNYMGIIRDMTERKKIENALNQTLSLTTAVLESIHDGILVIDHKGTAIISNKTFAEMWRIPNEIIKSNDDKTLLEFILNQLLDPNEFKSKVTELYANPEAESLDEIYFKDGRIFERISKPMFVGIETYGRVWSFLDITESRKIEAEKIYQLSRYKMLMHTSQDAIHILDENGKLLEWNEAFLKHLGYTEEETSDLNVRDWDTQWNNEEIKKILEETSEKGIAFETVHKTKDGSFRNVDIRFQQIIIKDKKLYYASGRDITERKNENRLLQKSENRFRQTLDSMLEGFMIIDFNWIYIYVNKVAAEHGQARIEDLIGNTMLQLYPGIEESAIFKHYQNCMKNRISEQFEESFTFSTGNTRCYSFSVQPIPDGIMVLSIDITERKLAEEEIKKSNRINKFIGKINELVLHAKNENEIYNGICKIAVETGNFVFAWIGLPNIKTKTIEPLVWAGNEDGYLKDIKISTEDIPEGSGTTGKAYREAKYYYCNDIANDSVMKYWKDKAIKRGYFSSVAFPLMVDDKVVSVITMYAAKTNFFSDEELQMLVNVVSNINYALNAINNNRKRIKAEIELNKFKQIADNSVAYINIANLNLEFIYINKAMRTGLSIPDNVDISQYKVLKLHSKNSKENLPIVTSALEKNGFWNGENEMMSFNDTIIPVLQTIILIKDADGNPQFTSSIAIDISAQKEREAELQKLAGIIENTKAIVFIIDLEFKFLYMNASAREKFEIGEEEDILQLSGLDFIPEETKQRMSVEQQKLFSEGKWVGEKVFMTKTGKLFSSLEVAIIHKDDEGNPKFISFTLLDITERITAEEALKLSESKLRAILDNSFDAIGLHQNGIWEMCNPAALKLFGYSNIEELIGKPILNVIVQSEHDRIKNYVRNRMEGKEAPSAYITRGLKKDGTEFDLEVSLSEFMQENKLHVLVILRNISDRLKNEKEMTRLNTELRELANHLSTIREEERSDIAKEIHDELAQNLVALSMNATRLKTKIHDDSVKAIIDEQIEISNSVVQTSKTLFNSLHPSMLDELGLEAAIKWYGKTKLKLTDIKFEFRTNAHIGNDNIPKEVNLGFFRIYQETVTNILRHAKASIISVVLIKSDDNLSMQIKDNGFGFDVDKVDTFEHHGLLGMRERVLSMGGEFTIESAVGKGTILKIKVPI